MNNFSLPELPYPYDALEPHIDAATMEIHYSKHHQNYLNKLNEALTLHPDLPQQTLEELLTSLDSVPSDIRTSVRNNAGGVHNHSFFWKIMSPRETDMPKSELATAIDSTFGNTSKLMEMFNRAANGIFGSGWAWLVYQNQRLEVITTPNQDSPVSFGAVPLLGLDVWEHAYYLKYQNRRADYVDAWWNIVNWPQVSENFEKARQKQTVS